MRNQWFIWALVAAVGVFVLFIFNYQGKQESVSLSDIFPDQDKKDSGIEYEFVNTPVKETSPSAVQTASQVSQSIPQATEQNVSQVPAAALTQPASATPPEAQMAQSKLTAVKTNVTPKTIAFGKVEQPETKVETEANNLSKTSYTIQVASYPDRRSAEIALKGIQAAGQPAYMIARDLGAKGTWYRIYVGKYEKKHEANSKLSELKPKYQNSFIISPKE